MVNKISTGVPGLDKITHGGIPVGRSSLIAGRSGTCKSVLALQIAAGLAHRGIKTLLFAVEEAPEDLITTGDDLGFDLTSITKSGALTLLDISRPVEGPTFVSGEYDIAGLIHRVEANVKQTGATAIVVDSITALFSPRPPPDALRAHFFELVYTFRKLGLTSVVTAEAPEDYGPLTTLGVEDFVCDMVLILRNIIDDGRRRRSIEVHKYRRSPHFKGEYPCTMTSKGLTVFPLDAQERPREVPTERYSSGLAGLDEMNQGGWLRDSIVLVRGPSGSGKTTLAGMYARAGASRGERVVYYGFEETKGILMRNFASLGMGMEPFEQSGNLRIECRYPEATSPEDLLVDLRVGLDEFTPSLVVLDSISSIEHSTSPRGFRQFMVGVASLLREHRRSALLTQAAAVDDETGAAPYLSTIADAIVRLDYTLHRHALERTMRVLKMRGSGHATDERRLELLHDGLRVGQFPRGEDDAAHAPRESGPTARH